MPYNEALDKRIVDAISNWGTNRKKMFGGTCYLLNGNMMCGVYRDYLILRLGEKQARDALERPFVMPCDITGRPMKGWVMVEIQGVEGERLTQWLKKARCFVETLPSK